MDLKEKPYETVNLVEGTIPSVYGTPQDVLDTSDIRSPSTRAAPRREKSSSAAQEAVGYGWDPVKLDVSSGNTYIRVASDSQVSNIGKAIWPPKRPFRGQECSGVCARKSITVDSAGFSPPRDQGKDTTVYILGADAAPYVVVSQYAHTHKKELYFVNYDECLACTILHVPAGSIVAGPLPKPFLK